MSRTRKSRLLALLVGVLAILAGVVATAVPVNAATNNSGACIGFCPNGLGTDKDVRYIYEPLSTLHLKPEDAGFYTGDMVYTFGYVLNIGTTPRCNTDGTGCPPDSTYAENDGDVHMILADENGNNQLVTEADPTGTLRYSALPHLTDNNAVHTTNCVVEWGFYRWDQGEPPATFPNRGVSELHPLVGWHYSTDPRCPGSPSNLGSGSYTVTHGTSACTAYCTTDGNHNYGFSWLTNLNCDPRAVYLNSGGTDNGCDNGPRVLTDGYIESAVYSNNSWTLSIDNGPANGHLNPIRAVVSPEEYWSFSYWTGNKGITVGGSNPTDVCLFGNLRYDHSTNINEIKPLVGFTKKSDAPGAYCPNVN